MLSILEKYKEYENTLKNKKSGKNKKNKDKKNKDKKSGKLKKYLFWGFIILIVSAMFLPKLLLKTELNNKKNNKNETKIISAVTNYPAKKAIEKKQSVQNNLQENAELLKGNNLKKELQKKKSKIVTKKIIQYYCKNIMPFNLNLVYYVKTDNKLIPVYNIESWNGVGLKFKINETKKVISVINDANKTFYEIEKNKYILPDNKSVKCFKQIKEINETI